MTVIHSGISIFPQPRKMTQFQDSDSNRVLLPQELLNWEDRSLELPSPLWREILFESEANTKERRVIQGVEDNMLYESLNSFST